MEVRRSILLVFLAAFSCHSVFTQQTQHEGIALHLQGKNEQAVSVLSSAVKQSEYKADAVMWNALGLAYFELRNYKKGKSSFEKAVKYAPENSVYRANLAYTRLMLRDTNGAQSDTDAALKIDPTNVFAHYVRGIASLWENNFDDAQQEVDAISALDPAYLKAYILGSNIQLGRLGKKISANGDRGGVKENIDFLKNSIEILQTGAEKCKADPNRKLIDNELESMNAFYRYFSREPLVPSTLAGSPAPPEPGVKPLKIISKQRASYTDAARNANVQGIIRVAVLFGASGRIEHILVFKRLGYGLDENAIAAVKTIKFEPRIKDGKPVSSVAIVEYEFNIY